MCGSTSECPGLDSRGVQSSGVLTHQHPHVADLSELLAVDIAIVTRLGTVDTQPLLNSLPLLSWSQAHTF